MSERTETSIMKTAWKVVRLCEESTYTGWFSYGSDIALLYRKDELTKPDLGLIFVYPSMEEIPLTYRTPFYWIMEGDCDEVIAIHSPIQSFYMFCMTRQERARILAFWRDAFDVTQSVSAYGVKWFTPRKIFSGKEFPHGIAYYSQYGRNAS